MAIDVLNTIEVDRTTSKYDIIDLNILEAKSRVEIKAKQSKLIDAANALYTMSQYHSL
jgi:hypothetical protein